MADTPDAGFRAFRPTRPPMPHRSLSSSLRVYTSPLLPQNARRSKARPSDSRLSPMHEATEIDSLLGFGQRNRALSSNLSFINGSVATGLDDQDDDDDADLEAEHYDEQADSDGLYPPNCCWTADGRKPPKRSDPFGNEECDVYGNIHRVRREIISSIDDPYSSEQLKGPRMNVSVVRPLVDKFYDMQDLSIVYCLLVNRVQFIREQSYAAHHQTVNLTRALLCELLAEKVLRRYNEHNPGPRGLLKLANILVAGFEPFRGAPEETIRASMQDLPPDHDGAHNYHQRLTTLEIAIVSESKSFLASTACQKVIDAIYRGKVVYSPTTFIDIIPDHWKRRPISLYDPRRAPVLNQYRMVVPRTRNWIEVIQFAILLSLYIWVMTGREGRRTTRFEAAEGLFVIYTFGWILDQIASVLEHGWTVYSQNLWSFLDVMFSTIFLIYFSLRMRGLAVYGNDDSDELAVAALDVLSCAAPILIPRLAFNMMSENMLFLSLRAMMGDFVTLTILAFWCFAGFLLGLKWLRNDIHHLTEISKWMIFVWFGLDGTGIDRAPSFHPVLGPVLMITFAFLGNTLFLTILVSMLSNTFSTISSNAIQEIQYRRAVLVFLGVKSDALFAFMPPFNLIAVIILGPLKFLLTPRMFHTVNVFMVRVVNSPVLLVISWYERNTLWVSSRYRKIKPKRIDWRHPGGPRVVGTDWWTSTLKFWDFSRLSAHGDIQSVFDNEPPGFVVGEDYDRRGNQALRSERMFFNNPGRASPPLGQRLKNRIHAQFNIPARRASHSAYETSDGGPESPMATTRGKDHERPHSPLTTTTTAPTTATANASTATSISTPRSKRKRRTKSRQFSVNDAALRKEFQDSEDEHEAESKRISGIRFLNKKNKRAERKDSLIDYDDPNFGAIEANSRLKGLERKLARMEELLIRAVTAAEELRAEEPAREREREDSESISPGHSEPEEIVDNEHASDEGSGPEVEVEEAVMKDRAKETGEFL